MNFKLWLEVVDPFSPKTVRMNRIVKNSGTAQAQPAMQFRWKTRLGNDVKVHFEDRGDGIYNIVFYVNDTLFDNASKVEGVNRDAEILPGVFDIAKRKADQLKATTLIFTAHRSDGDTKVVKGIDPSPILRLANEELVQFEHLLRSHRPTLMPLNQTKIALFQKLGRPLPQGEPDFDASPWLRWLDEVKVAISNKNGYGLENLVDNFKSSIYTNRFSVLKIDLMPLARNLENLMNAFMSNSKSGWRRTLNRRAAIYSKLLRRYFGDHWTVSIQGDRFELTRNGSDA